MRTRAMTALTALLLCRTLATSALAASGTGTMISGAVCDRLKEQCRASRDAVACARWHKGCDGRYGSVCVDLACFGPMTAAGVDLPQAMVGCPCVEDLRAALPAPPRRRCVAPVKPDPDPERKPGELDYDDLRASKAYEAALKAYEKARATGECVDGPGPASNAVEGAPPSR